MSTAGALRGALILLALLCGCATTLERAEEQERERIAEQACQVCGEVIPDEAAYLHDSAGRRWHKACYDSRPKCGLTGRPIPDDDDVVTVEGKTFHRAWYDAAEKCIASHLPLRGSGPYIINPRSGTKVLKAYLSRTRRCVSCGDQRVRGETIKGERFVCAWCVRSYREGLSTSELLGDVREFFAAEGLPTPKVALRFGSFSDGLSATRRGICRTTTTTRGVERSYEHVITLLGHMNRDVSAATLAHEYMHAVLARRPRKLSKLEEEGLCELASWRYARSRELPAYIPRNIEQNQVEQYRRGFELQRDKRRSLRELFEAD